MVKKYKPGNDELYELYINQGLSTVEIGKIYDFHDVTVGRWLKKYDIPIRTTAESLLIRSGGIKPSKDELIELYVNKGLSAPEICDIYNVGESSIYRWLNEYEIEIRSISESHLIKNGGIKPSKDELYHDYCVEFLSTYEIAKKYNVYSWTICAWLNEYEIERRTTSESKLLKSGGTKPSKEELYNDYWIEHMSTYEIARKYGVTDKTIGNWLKEYDIDIKPWYLRESKYVNSVKEYLDSLPMYYKTEDKIYGNLKRCDITLPFIKLAIEVNDTETHNLENNKYSNRTGKDFYYHQQKTMEAWENGWVLIHLWEKDIDNFKSIIDDFIDNRYSDNLHPVFSEPSVFTDNGYTLADDGCKWI
jgi:transposase